LYKALVRGHYFLIQDVTYLILNMSGRF